VRLSAIGIGSGGATGIIMYVTGMKLYGATLAIIGTVAVFRAIVHPFRHSHIWVTYGKTLDRFFISPSMHIIHHSVLPKHRDKNLGDFVALWDHIFGTLYVPDGPEEFPLGISAEETGAKNPHTGFFRWLIEPTITSVQSLLSRAKQPGLSIPDQRANSVSGTTGSAQEVARAPNSNTVS
jgi:hypothetical protein